MKFKRESFAIIMKLPKEVLRDVAVFFGGLKHSYCLRLLFNGLHNLLLCLQILCLSIEKCGVCVLLRAFVFAVWSFCASQFVVMFTAADGMKEGKRVCNAYISQSTRGLRSLLREHDISYSMPFCSSEVEQISREDLVELSEILKQNLGQAKRMSSMPDVDSSPKSLLAVNGNENVYELYDFLLNYRYITVFYLRN
ncbi:uncharacterized protein LOC141628984 [Silene latifolia]|uniref:uncharacterized protein LOC141628984 n=1 Tax=Silene latifolia TaxID=37657 RepID=UPI003D78A741